jgi:hypothetical protein
MLIRDAVKSGLIVGELAMNTLFENAITTINATSIDANKLI